VHTFLFAMLVGYYGRDLAKSGDSLFILTTYFMIIWLGSLLQMLYRGERPFWALKGDVKNLAGGCLLTYGGPSTGVMMATYLMLTLYLNYYYQVGEPPKQFASVMCTGYIIKMGITSFTLTALIGFGLTNVYLGVNSYDQTLLAVVLAAYFAFWFHFKLKIHFKLLPYYMSQKNFVWTLCPWFGRYRNEEDMQAQPSRQPATFYRTETVMAAAGVAFLVLLVIPQLALHITWAKLAPQELSKIPASDLSKDVPNGAAKSPFWFYDDLSNGKDQMVHILK